MIERAKENVSEANLVISNNGINFKEIFNLVYCIAVFAHIDDEILLKLFPKLQ